MSEAQAQKFLEAERRKKAKLEAEAEAERQRGAQKEERTKELAWQHEVQEMKNKLAASEPGELMLKAATEGNAEEVEKLFRSGQSPNFPDNLPFFLAAKGGHTSTVLTLCNYCKGDIHFDTKAEQHHLTPLFVAAAAGFSETVDALAGLGLSVEPLDSREETPFLNAANAGLTDVMIVLHKYGADINYPDKGGCTPLFRCAMKQNLPLLKMLIDWGAEIDKCESGGHTPLAITVIYRNMDAMKMLVDAGAAINFPNCERVTPISIAAAAGFRRVVEFFIEKGANATAKDKNGHTPAWKAAMAGYRDVLELLIEHGAADKKDFVWALTKFTKAQNMDNRKAYAQQYPGMRAITPYLGKERVNYGLRVLGKKKKVKAIVPHR